MRTALFSLLLLLSVASQISLAQKRYAPRYSYLDGYSLTATAGIPYIVGELHGIQGFPTIYNLSLEKGFSPKISGRLTVMSGTAHSQNSAEYHAYARNNYWGVSIAPVINLTALFAREQERQLKCYMSVGIGLLRFHTDVYNINDQLLRTTSNSTSRHTPIFQQFGPGSGAVGIYYTREVFIPLTFSCDYKLLPRLYLNGSVGVNWISTDKFDGTTPYNLSDPYFVEGPNSYSNTANDGWVNVNIGLKYKFIAQRFIHQRGI